MQIVMDLRQIKQVFSDAENSYASLELFVTEILPEINLPKEEKEIIVKSISYVFLIDKIKRSIIQNQDYQINGQPLMLEIDLDLMNIPLKLSLKDNPTYFKFDYEENLTITNFSAKFDDGRQFKKFKNNGKTVDEIIKIAIREMQSVCDRWKRKCAKCNKMFEDPMDLLRHINVRESCEPTIIIGCAPLCVVDDIPSGY